MQKTQFPQSIPSSPARTLREHLLNASSSTYLVLEAGAVIASDLHLICSTLVLEQLSPSHNVSGKGLLIGQAVFSVVYCCHQLDWSSSLSACRGCNEEAEQRVHLALALTRSLSVYPSFAPSSPSLSLSHTQTHAISVSLPHPATPPRSRSLSFSFPPYASLPPLVLSLSHCIDLPALAFSSCSL